MVKAFEIAGYGEKEVVERFGGMYRAFTGDSKTVGEAVASELGIKEVYAETLPADKVRITEDLSSKTTKGKLVFVGDGVNDAPALARADVGVAMGALGSDAAIEAADVVMMTDEPSKLAAAIKISKRTVRIAKQNIVFAISVKMIIMVLGIMGIATMWEAMFADVGVSMIAILNAMRTLRYKAVPITTVDKKDEHFRSGQTV
jgi:Cd2+/Zn2+-exporting ATPase